MSMCSENRNVKHLAGQYVGSTGTSADHCSSGTEDPGVRTLGTAKTEFHDGIALGCVAYTCCLSGNKTLMVHNVQDGRLYKLSSMIGAITLTIGSLGKITVPSGIA